METKESKEPRPKNAVQLLLSRVDNMRNDMAMLRNRVENLEKSLPNLKDYIKEQMIELYSQIEAARETMDEITSFFEEMNREEEEEDEHERDFIIEQELERFDETVEDSYPSHDEVTELELPDEEYQESYNEEINDESTLPTQEDGTEQEIY